MTTATKAIRPPSLDVLPFDGQRVDNAKITTSLIASMANAEREELLAIPEPQDAETSRSRVRTLSFLEQLANHTRVHHWRGRQRYATQDTIPEPGNVPTLSLPGDEIKGKNITDGLPDDVRPQVSAEIQKALEKLLPFVQHGQQAVNDKRRLLVVQMLDGDNDYDPKVHAEFIAEHKLTVAHVQHDAKAYQLAKTVHAEQQRVAEMLKSAEQLESETDELWANVAPLKRKLDEIIDQDKGRSNLKYMQELRQAESEFHAANDPYAVKKNQLDSLNDKIARSDRMSRSRATSVFNTSSSLESPLNFALQEPPRDPNEIRIPV